MIVFSFMSGTVHPYYAVALAPAIGALVAIGGRKLWQHRQSHVARSVLALMIAGTAVWGWYLMNRDASGWQSWLAWAMLGGGLLGALVLAISAGRLKKFAVAAVLVGSIAVVGGSAGFTAATVATAHSGSVPMAGPSVLASTGMGLGGAQAPTGGSSNAELITLLDATTTRWSAAVVGDQAAAGYILSTNTAVLAIGGWSGSDDAPTLAQFQQYVKDGKIGYFIADAGRSGGPGGGSDSAASQISAWVAANYTAKTVGGVTVYDLTS
jgi:hypothetical protein